VRKTYWDDCKEDMSDLLKDDVFESGRELVSADFALCDFYQPSEYRFEWPWGGLGELWSQAKFKPTDGGKSSSHIVPINRLAGKFLPVRYKQDELTQLQFRSANQRTLDEAKNGKAELMGVFRFPLRTQ
jgi:hypothetical protein